MTRLSWHRSRTTDPSAGGDTHAEQRQLLVRAARLLEAATCQVHSHDLAPEVLRRVRREARSAGALASWWRTVSPEWRAVQVAATVCLLVTAVWLVSAAPWAAPPDQSLLDPGVALELVVEPSWLGGGP